MSKSIHHSYFTHLVRECEKVGTPHPPVVTTSRNVRLQAVKHTDQLATAFQNDGNLARWLEHIAHLVRYARGLVPLLDGCGDDQEAGAPTELAPIGAISPAFMAAIVDSDATAEDAEAALPRLSHLLTEYSVRGYLSGKPGVSSEALRDGSAPLVAGDYLLEAILNGHAVVAAALIDAGARLDDAARVANARMKKVPHGDGVIPVLQEVDDLLRNHVVQPGGIDIVLEADRRQRAVLMNLEISGNLATPDPSLIRHRSRVRL